MKKHLHVVDMSDMRVIFWSSGGVSRSVIRCVTAATFYSSDCVLLFIAFVINHINDTGITIRMNYPCLVLCTLYKSEKWRKCEI